MRRPSLIEWSADCNNDGIVDYGQCRNGSLPDHDGDNVPDCCEAGEPCVTGNYPVQWRAEDGGNGHWYEIFNRAGEGKIDWLASRATAVERGGDLATFTSEAETNAFLSMTSGQTQGNPWIGLFEDPAGGWRWATGEPLAWTNWAPTEPSGDGDWANMWIDYGPAGMWNDYRPTNPQGPDGFVVEWSADCNNDGVVDYGQILRGDFADVNRNGIPDGTCECLGDVLLDGNINGADLGAVLFYWGPAPAGSAARACDFNADGQVDGADLGILLAAWGPCPG